MKKRVVSIKSVVMPREKKMLSTNKMPKKLKEEVVEVHSDDDEEVNAFTKALLEGVQEEVEEVFSKTKYVITEEEKAKLEKRAKKVKESPEELMSEIYELQEKLVLHPFDQHDKEEWKNKLFDLLAIQGIKPGMYKATLDNFFDVVKEHRSRFVSNATVETIETAKSMLVQSKKLDQDIEYYKTTVLDNWILGHIATDTMYHLINDDTISSLTHLTRVQQRTYELPKFLLRYLQYGIEEDKFPFLADMTFNLATPIQEAEFKSFRFTNLDKLPSLTLKSGKRKLRNLWNLIHSIANNKLSLLDFTAIGKTDFSNQVCVKDLSRDKLRHIAMHDLGKTENPEEPFSEKDLHKICKGADLSKIRISDLSEEKLKEYAQVLGISRKNVAKSVLLKNLLQMEQFVVAALKSYLWDLIGEIEWQMEESSLLSDRVMKKIVRKTKDGYQVNTSINGVDLPFTTTSYERNAIEMSAMQNMLSALPAYNKWLFKWYLEMYNFYKNAETSRIASVNLHIADCIVWLERAMVDLIMQPEVESPDAALNAFYGGVTNNTLKALYKSYNKPEYMASFLGKCQKYINDSEKEDTVPELREIPAWTLFDSDVYLVYWTWFEKSYKKIFQSNWTEEPATWRVNDVEFEKLLLAMPDGGATWKDRYSNFLVSSDAHKKIMTMKKLVGSISKNIVNIREVIDEVRSHIKKKMDSDFRDSFIIKKWESKLPSSGETKKEREARYMAMLQVSNMRLLIKLVGGEERMTNDGPVPRHADYSDYPELNELFKKDMARYRKMVDDVNLEPIEPERATLGDDSEEGEKDGESKSVKINASKCNDAIRDLLKKRGSSMRLNKFNKCVQPMPVPIKAAVPTADEKVLYNASLYEQYYSLLRQRDRLVEEINKLKDHMGKLFEDPFYDKTDAEYALIQERQQEAFQYMDILRSYSLSMNASDLLFMDPAVLVSEDLERLASIDFATQPHQYLMELLQYNNMAKLPTMHFVPAWENLESFAEEIKWIKFLVETDRNYKGIITSIVNSYFIDPELEVDSVIKTSGDLDRYIQLLLNLTRTMGIDKPKSEEARKTRYYLLWLLNLEQYGFEMSGSTVYLDELNASVEKVNALKGEASEWKIDDIGFINALTIYYRRCLRFASMNNLTGVELISFLSTVFRSPEDLRNTMEEFDTKMDYNILGERLEAIQKEMMLNSMAQILEINKRIIKPIRRGTEINGFTIKGKPFLVKGYFGVESQEALKLRASQIADGKRIVPMGLYGNQTEYLTETGESFGLLGYEIAVEGRRKPMQVYIETYCPTIEAAWAFAVAYCKQYHSELAEKLKLGVAYKPVINLQDYLREDKRASFQQLLSQVAKMIDTCRKKATSKRRKKAKKQEDDTESKGISKADQAKLKEIEILVSVVKDMITYKENPQTNFKLQWKILNRIKPGYEARIMRGIHKGKRVRIVAVEGAELVLDGIEQRFRLEDVVLGGAFVRTPVSVPNLLRFYEYPLEDETTALRRDLVYRYKHLSNLINNHRFNDVGEFDSDENNRLMDLDAEIGALQAIIDNFDTIPEDEREKQLRQHYPWSVQRDITEFELREEIAQRKEDGADETDINYLESVLQSFNKLSQRRLRKKLQNYSPWAEQQDVIAIEEVQEQVAKLEARLLDNIPWKNLLVGSIIGYVHNGKTLGVAEVLEVRADGVVCKMWSETFVGMNNPSFLEIYTQLYNEPIRDMFALSELPADVKNQVNMARNQIIRENKAQWRAVHGISGPSEYTVSFEHYMAESDVWTTETGLMRMNNEELVATIFELDPEADPHINPGMDMEMLQNILIDLLDSMGAGGVFVPWNSISMDTYTDIDLLAVNKMNIYEGRLSYHHGKGFEIETGEGVVDIRTGITEQLVLGADEFVSSVDIKSGAFLNKVVDSIYDTEYLGETQVRYGNRLDNWIATLRDNEEISDRQYKMIAKSADKYLKKANISVADEIGLLQRLMILKENRDLIMNRQSRFNLKDISDFMARKLSVASPYYNYAMQTGLDLMNKKTESSEAPQIQNYEWFSYKIFIDILSMYRDIKMDVYNYILMLPKLLKGISVASQLPAYNIDHSELAKTHNVGSAINIMFTDTMYDTIQELYDELDNIVKYLNKEDHKELPKDVRKVLAAMDKDKKVKRMNRIYRYQRLLEQALQLEARYSGVSSNMRKIILFCGYGLFKDSDVKTYNFPDKHFIVTNWENIKGLQSGTKDAKGNMNKFDLVDDACKSLLTSLIASMIIICRANSDGFVLDKVAAPVDEREAEINLVKTMYKIVKGRSVYRRSKAEYLRKAIHAAVGTAAEHDVSGETKKGIRRKLKKLNQQFENAEGAVYDKKGRLISDDQAAIEKEIGILEEKLRILEYNEKSEATMERKLNRIVETATVVDYTGNVYDCKDISAMMFDSILPKANKTKLITKTDQMIDIVQDCCVLLGNLTEAANKITEETGTIKVNMVGLANKYKFTNPRMLTEMDRLKEMIRWYLLEVENDRLAAANEAQLGLTMYKRLSPYGVWDMLTEEERTQWAYEELLEMMDCKTIEEDIQTNTGDVIVVKHTYDYVLNHLEISRGVEYMESRIALILGGNLPETVKQQLDVVMQEAELDKQVDRTKLLGRHAGIVDVSSALAIVRDPSANSPVNKITKTFADAVNNLLKDINELYGVYYGQAITDGTERYLLAVIRGQNRSENVSLQTSIRNACADLFTPEFDLQPLQDAINRVRAAETDEQQGIEELNYLNILDGIKQQVRLGLEAVLSRVHLIEESNREEYIENRVNAFTEHGNKYDGTVEAVYRSRIEPLADERFLYNITKNLSEKRMDMERLFQKSYMSVADVEAAVRELFTPRQIKDRVELLLNIMQDVVVDLSHVKVEIEMYNDWFRKMMSALLDDETTVNPVTLMSDVYKDMFINRFDISYIEQMLDWIYGIAGQYSAQIQLCLDNCRSLYRQIVTNRVHMMKFAKINDEVSVPRYKLPGGRAMAMVGNRVQDDEFEAVRTELITLLQDLNPDGDQAILDQIDNTGFSMEDDKTKQGWAVSCRKYLELEKLDILPSEVESLINRGRLILDSYGNFLMGLTVREMRKMKMLLEDSIDMDSIRQTGVFYRKTEFLNSGIDSGIRELDDELESSIQNRVEMYESTFKDNNGNLKKGVSKEEMESSIKEFKANLERDTRNTLKSIEVRAIAKQEKSVSKWSKEIVKGKASGEYGDEEYDDTEDRRREAQEEERYLSAWSRGRRGQKDEADDE